MQYDGQSTEESRGDGAFCGGGVVFVSVREEHVATETEKVGLRYSMIELLENVWNSSTSVVRTLKLLLGVIQTYIVRHKRSDPIPRRMYEARKMKDLTLQALEFAQKKKEMSSSNRT